MSWTGTDELHREAGKDWVTDGIYQQNKNILKKEELKCMILKPAALTPNLVNIKQDYCWHKVRQQQL